jgi:hypothetical protein
VAQHKDLDDQPGPMTGQQREPAEYSNRDQIDNTNDH